MHRAFRAVVGTLVLGASASALAAAPATYPLARVHRGQTGYGLTTMQGTSPVRFTFEVVGVVHNFLPKQDIILVKSDDPKLKVTGFWQGMSGSPLYLDNKVACAFSYGFRFNKIALGGCTPIEYMKRDGMVVRRGGAAGGAGQAPEVVRPAAATLEEWRRLTPTGDLGTALDTLGPARGDWLLSTPLPPPPTRPAEGETMAAAVPLAVAGFTAPAFAQVEKMFGDYDLSPMRAGGTGAPSPGGPRHFQMGGSIAVQLIRGDMSAAAIGTVSYVDGPQVLAFGHPMFQVGEFYAPVATTEVHTVIPSSMSAFVMASPAREAGTLVEDRQTTIAASTRLRTRMIPLDITILTGHGKQTRSGEFHVQILDNKFLTGALAGAAAMNAVGYYLPDRDHATARIDSEVELRGAEPIRFVDYLYAPDGAGAVVGGARGLRALVPLLMNPFAPVDVERVSLKIDLRYAPDYGNIKEVRLPAPELAPGKRAWLEVVLTPTPAPRGSTGSRSTCRRGLAGSICQLEVTAGDSASLDAAPPIDLPSLLRAFHRLLPGNVYAVSLYGADQGVALDGKIVRDLPASALDKLHPGTSTQKVATYRPVARTLSPAKRVVNGKVTVLVRIADGRSAPRAGRRPVPAVLRAPGPPRGPVKHRALSVLAAAAVLGLAAPASAVVTATWTVETFKDFDAGDATDAFITSLGEVRPGWTTRRVGLEGESVWAAARLRDGSTLIATDEDGAIYRVNGTKVKKVVVDRRRDRGVGPGRRPRRHGLRRRDAERPAVEDRRRRRQGDPGRQAQGHRDDLVAGGRRRRHDLGRDRTQGPAVRVSPRRRQGRLRHRGQAGDLGRRDVATARCGSAPATAPWSTATIPSRASPARWATSPATRSPAIAELRGGAVVAANDLDEATSHGTKSAATVARRREAQARQGHQGQGAQGRHQAGRRQGDAVGDRHRPQGRAQGQGRAVLDRRRRPARPAPGPDRHLLHVDRGQPRRQGLRRRRRQGPGLHGRARRLGRDRVRRRRARGVAAVVGRQGAGVRHRRHRRDVPGHRPGVEGQVRQRRPRRQGAGPLRRAALAGERQDQGRDPNRQHVEAGPGLEHLAGDRRRDPAGRRHGGGADREPARAATSSSGSRSRTTGPA